MYYFSGTLPIVDEKKTFCLFFDTIWEETQIKILSLESPGGEMVNDREHCLSLRTYFSCSCP